MTAGNGAVLRRRLGLADAVVIGLGAMLGAGIFAALGPAAAAARRWLPVALVLAAAVAYLNATSSARLAARYPQSGGSYVYGRERLGPFWGYLAGWSFVVGKAASCAAMALTVGVYLWPRYAHPVAVVVVLVLAAVDHTGVRRSALVTRLIVVVVLAVLAIVVIACLTSGTADPGRRVDPGGPAGGDAGVLGVLRGAGLLFFAFAGYARIATLGEEVRDPARTIPRAITLALAITLAVYAAVVVAVVAVLGGGLATAGSPLADAVRAAGRPELSGVVRTGAAVAAVGSLLALLLGVSRTVLAMARDRHLPRGLAAVHPRFGVPHRAGWAVAAAVAVVAGAVDLREAIGFSSFAVLTYYAVAHASAWTLTPQEGRPPRAVPALGLLGCLALALALPVGTVAAGVAVLGLGALVYGLRRRARSPLSGWR